MKKNNNNKKQLITTEESFLKNCVVFVPVPFLKTQEDWKQYRCIQGRP